MKAQDPQAERICFGIELETTIPVTAGVEVGAYPNGRPVFAGRAHGTGIERLPGRWVFFDRDFTEVIGDWRMANGMRVSNFHFLDALPCAHTPPTRRKTARGTQDTKRGCK